MASLSFSHFLSFPSFFPRRHNCHQQLQLQQQRPDLCRFRASSIGKPRKNAKTNAELCDEIREFINANGLPEGYVPTMKEFSQLGRSDLAYIVRRRGYKVIGEILGNTDLSGSCVDEKGDSDEKAVFCDNGDIKLTAAKISSDSLVIEDGFSSTKLPIVENHVESQEISIESSSMDDYHLDSVASSGLSGIDIDGAEEASGDLSGIDINGAEEASSALSGIDIDRAEEASCDLSGIDIDEAEEVSSDFSGIDFDGAEEASGDFSGIDIDGTEEASSSLYGIDIDKAEEGLSDLSGIDIDETKEASSDFSGIDFDGAEEASGDLSGIDIDGAEEAPSALSGTDMERAEEASSDISVINIDEVDKASSDLSTTDIDDAEDGSLVAELNNEEIHSANLYVESSQTGFHKNLNMVKDVAFSSIEIFTEESLPSSSVNVCNSQVSYEDRETSEELSSLSLEDKVANFMRYGHLDTLEDSKSDGKLVESDIEERKENIELVVENVQNGGNSDTNLNGDAVKPITETDPLRDANPQVPCNQGLDDKTQTSKWDNTVEINHLKFMLHEKALELSRLKEQIEKEKHALSLLQAKAELEISRAQKVISEKDAELLAAEEMLSELVEVPIIYHGDGELVEVAGSFNGWHHWIKLDPQPLSSTTYTTESRKSKIWSTMLWLYPGIYEIKFVVDGEWRIDPQMESVSNGAICNNILRVQR